MDGYGNYDPNYYPNDGEDPLPADAPTGGGGNDPNDDFDPFELLQSPLFDNNKGGHSRAASTVDVEDDGGEGNDYGYSSQQKQQQQQQQGMPPAAAVTPGSSASSASSPPFSGVPQNNYGAQASSLGSGMNPGYQFGGGGGGMGQGQQQQAPMGNLSNQGGMDGSGRRSAGGGGGGMSPNMSAMNGGMAAMNMNGMNPMGAGGNANFAGMQGNNMPQQMQGMNNMNAAALRQMSQMQGMNMQQAMQQQNMMQGNPMQQQAAANGMMGNPMQAAAMMNAMQPRMGGAGQFNNPNMQGQMAMQNMGMNGMQVGRNGSLNTALQSMNPGQQGGGGPAAFHQSMSAIQGPSFQGGGGGVGVNMDRAGSLPTSPNPTPSVAQLSASVQMRNSSSRSGGRVRGPTPKVDANGKIIANTPSDPGINEAMEKLCESMRRSAMSRNLVKQLSGRSVQRQGSSRTLSRSNSSGTGMRKHLASHGRSMSGNLGGMGGDGSGRDTPTRTVPIRRLSGAKHRLIGRAAPGNRGAFRQNSMGSQGSVGGNGARTFLQLDDQSLGAL
ncbi:expressed unknown protein [Seminavis robusta]|uniref:Uncharacterized protein n=1 Tax=Seminavis robusta TaxID=568900 RepID=A0A9N8H7Z4_9STRA|nr:expressed unknown protein [Seminavis robusta]|eukprot:Sro143_g066790.1 n/a (552) ;mRNA; r:98183-99838